MHKQDLFITMVDCEKSIRIYNKTENHKQPVPGKPLPEPARVEHVPSPGALLAMDDLRSPVTRGILLERIRKHIMLQWRNFFFYFGEKDFIDFFFLLSLFFVQVIPLFSLKFSFPYFHFSQKNISFIIISAKVYLDVCVYLQWGWESVSPGNGGVKPLIMCFLASGMWGFMWVCCVNIV